jgi:hypothetical protein
MGYEGVGTNSKARDSEQWRVTVNTVMDSGFMKGGNSFSYLNDWSVSNKDSAPRNVF